MRYFDLLNLQHLIASLFPALVIVLLFAAALGYIRTRRRKTEEEENRIIEEFPGGIKGRNAPFPLFLTLVIIGTIFWILAYILFIGLTGVTI